MISYEVCYYNGKLPLGVGQILKEWQLKHVKELVEPYFKMLNVKEINIRIIQSIEV